MVQILDTTLREGEQTLGVCFPPHIKFAIAKSLDTLGVDIIEVGHPIVNKEICSAVNMMAHADLRPKIGAHSRSLQSDVDLALECGVGFLGIFYCVSDERLTNVFKKDLGSAIKQITDVIRYAKSQKPNLLIRYTPEDTVRSQFENVVKASTAAVEAGADIISIADTTGYMIPGVKGRSMYDYVTKLKERLDKNKVHPKLEVHCHNDLGLALVNTLEAHRAGANILDTTVLGLGERAGITDLATLLTVLTVGFDEPKWDLKQLIPLYNLVSKFSRRNIPKNAPIVGEDVFTHCAGVHTQAAIQNPIHYQSFDPKIVGRESHVCLGQMSGISSIKYMLEKVGRTDLDESLVKKITSYVKNIKYAVDEDELLHIVDWINLNNHHELQGVNAI